MSNRNSLKHALDSKLFHHDANVTWATSDLRKWLNVWFMPKAFTNGAKPAQALAVGLAGAVSDHLNTGVMVEFVGVRPALRVKLQ